MRWPGKLPRLAIDRRETVDIGALATAFFNTPGVGGAIVILVFGGACGLYIGLLRWVLRGGKEGK